MGFMIELLINEAINEAEQAILRNDEPYGAVIANEKGEIIATEGNRENTMCNPCAHAELLAISKACQRLNKKDLKNCVIVTNYKPCPMCASAILMCGIKKVYIGSEFEGFKKLFTHTAEKIEENQNLLYVKELRKKECVQQVLSGREYLKKNIPNYVPGHKNGIL